LLNKYYQIKIKDFNYKKGYENGSQRMWWSDGKIRANYVIKNGKKYGLLGYKICVNPYDSVNAK
jgi:antitoxin component YwqK of YwqJK toxin-antitoxin module